MKKSSGSLMVVVAVLCSVLGTWAVPVMADGSKVDGGKVAVVWPVGDLKWSDNPAMAGAKVAVLWGDPKTGAYGSLKKIAGGNSLPSHTHTRDQKVVMISGAIVLTVEGIGPKELGPGSYALIPGGVKHTADCKAGAECMYFEEQAGASDIKFVK